MLLGLPACDQIVWNTAGLAKQQAISWLHGIYPAARGISIYDVSFSAFISKSLLLAKKPSSLKSY